MLGFSDRREIEALRGKADHKDEGVPTEREHGCAQQVSTVQAPRDTPRALYRLRTMGTGTGALSLPRLTGVWSDSFCNKGGASAQMMGGTCPQENTDCAQGRSRLGKVHNVLTRALGADQDSADYGNVP